MKYDDDNKTKIRWQSLPYTFAYIIWAETTIKICMHNFFEMFHFGYSSIPSKFDDYEHVQAINDFNMINVKSRDLKQIAISIILTHQNIFIFCETTKVQILSVLWNDQNPPTQK